MESVTQAIMNTMNSIFNSLRLQTKELFSILIASLSLMSCTQESLQIVEKDKGQELVFYANSTHSTKTVLQDGGKVFWSPNDSIILNVYGPNVSEMEYPNSVTVLHSINKEPIQRTKFIGETYNLPESPVYVAIHPSSIESSWNNIVIPETQFVGDSNFDNFITVAKSTNDTLSFHQIMGGISISVKRNDIKRIEIDGIRVPLSGQFWLSYDSFELGQPCGGANISVLALPQNGDTFIPDKDYYIAIPPRTFDEGLKVSYYTGTEKGTYYVDTPLICQRGTIYKTGPFDDRISFSPYTDNTSTLCSLDWNLYNLHVDIKRLEFHTNSDVITDNLIESDGAPAYAEIDGTTVRIHTTADSFSTSSSFNFYHFMDSMESIDMGVFDFSKGGIARTFVGMKALKSVDLSNVITIGVIDMSGCFQGCNSLESLDLSAFNTDNVINMRDMFGECYSLKSVDLSSFNTSNTQDMAGMFMNCKSLETLDLSGFDMSSVSSTSSMFYGCKSLIDLKLSGSKTAPIHEVSGMFRECIKLSKLDLSSFDLSGVEDALGMFNSCFSLTELNLGDFNISTIEYPNVEIFTNVASASKSCNIICRRDVIEKLLHEADEFTMFANSLRYINWYVPGEPEPVYRAPDYSDLYTSTDYSHDGEYKLLQRATSGNGIDIVIMGDYFSDRLIADGTYERDLQKAIDAIFIHEPFKTFQNLFNVYMVTVVSPHETVDGIGALDSSTMSPLPDRLLLYAPGELSSERYYETVFIVLANIVDYTGGRVDHYFDPYKEQRTTDYGSGLTTMFLTNFSGIDKFNETAIHEFGHAFGKLADEYWYDDNSELTDYWDQEYVRTQHEIGYFKNISITDNPSEVPWSKFLAIDRYVNDGLGIFEGGYANYGKGVWRPTENSIMRFNTGGFNAPSREAIYYRIHKLAYGDDWEYSFEDFLEYDLINFE